MNILDFFSAFIIYITFELFHFSEENNGVGLLWLLSDRVQE